ncbi:N,N-dimethylformamidase large subunit [Paraburkholderia guartelaensis]|uniref:N,N-dimethylformamidase large subunit n=1 Tax=Paraburkholderia guartelaensis TaxID=2546446 RepID=A0A4R5L3Z1_9BURK|nr:N,N-dimethylformamidase beta subunit family domain-containing protein [Paraburkholderia guartelaensis]TDG03333.1 N,N-dimethylformamidase large subunit [Paraburkholderia guartelaensis]
MITITGYSDILSAEPGETVEFKVSSKSPHPFTAELVRVIHADPHPAGPGMRFEPLGHVFAGTFASVDKPLQQGSFARVSAVPAVGSAIGLTAGARIQPTALGRGEQCVLSQWNTARQAGFALLVSERGIELRLGAGRGQTEVRVLCAARLDVRWYDIWFAIDAASNRIEVGVAEVDDSVAKPLRCRTLQTLDAGWRAPHHEAAADLLIGALEDDAGRGAHFNGKIEAPFVANTPPSLARQATTVEYAVPRASDFHADVLFAAWDFAHGIDTLEIADTTPHARHGSLHNLPTRAVRSSAWSGRERCWRSAPGHYAAIHFHDDDLHDAGWATDFTFTVPASLKSGAYAMRLSVESATDYLPFYVRPELGRPGAPLVFVAATYTYQAYANYARGNFDAALRDKVERWGAYPHNPDDHPEVGLATYNLHSDGSGVTFSSRLRPMLTMRPGFLTFDDPRGSGCRHYIADSHLLDWLEHEGFAFDVVTDDDLERFGAALLEPYAAVLTGTHPEYHTAATLDALAGYKRSGGNLAYLGGNGFYWRVGCSARVPGALEVRRTEGGVRAWAAEPGEYFHALDGEYGGLWRGNARPPQQLVGVGFSSQGPFEGSHYRVLDAARTLAGGSLLKDISGPLFGGYGLSGGGAAGFELDSTEPADGTPAGVTILARSEGHSAAFGPALDALLSHTTTRARKTPDTLIRSEIIYYETGYGGAVFSVGSITFCGALSHNDYRNDVSTLLRNVLVRFSHVRDANVNASPAIEQTEVN